MSRFASPCAAFVLSLVCFAGFSAADAQAAIRAGSEFRVNTYTTGYQSAAAVALGANGSFVVAWSSRPQDGANYGIFARRFSASGAPQAAEFQVNTHTLDYQTYPAVAVDGDGDFVVAWASGFGQDGSFYGVFARRFSASGSPQASEFQVNAYTVETQEYPAVAFFNNGDFIVSWQSFGQEGSMYGIFARRFSSSGAALAAEFQVNVYTESGQYQPSVAVGDDGRFVIVWQSDEQDGSGNGVFARRFDSAGVAQAVEFQVNAYTDLGQSTPSVAMSGSGDFVVAWYDEEQDGSDNGIFARRFDSAGVAQGGEIQVNVYATGSQRFAGAAIDDDGDFVVVWSSYLEDGSSYGVFARGFSGGGSPLTGELQVNTYTQSRQRFGVVAMEPGGDFVVAWRSLGQDGDKEGVFAQRFVELAVLDIDGDGETAPLTDGLLVLRFLFGFTGGTLVNGAVDAVACTRCTAPAIEGYLQTLM